MHIEIWSDVICPWCYIGKRRFEAALAQFPRHDNVQITWRSFELDPHAPRRYEGTLDEMLVRKYGVSAVQAAAMNARVTALAEAEGLHYRLAGARPGNTLDAHRLLHVAAARQQGTPAIERLMQAYFCEELPVGDCAALARLAPEFGITENEAFAILEGEEYADAVRADERRAAELGISGVPFFVFDGKFGVSGAQPVQTFAEALQQAAAQSQTAAQ